MTTFVVTRKSDGQEVYRYNADAPIEWSGMEFATHDHATEAVDPSAPTDAPIVAMTWTKLAFERKFTDAEWAAAQDFNAGFEGIALLTDEQKLKIRRGLNDYKIATEISSIDPGTVTLLGLYEAFGVIASGRAQEILNGN
jgi:hypothetical protein